MQRQIFKTFFFVGLTTLTGRLCQAAGDIEVQAAGLPLSDPIANPPMEQMIALGILLGGIIAITVAILIALFKPPFRS